MKLAQKFSNVVSLDVVKPNELMECYGNYVIDALTGKEGCCTLIIFEDYSAVLMSNTASVWFDDPKETTVAVMGNGIREYWMDFPGLPEIREKFRSRISSIKEVVDKTSTD